MQLFYIAIKDFLLVLRDKKALLLLLVMPLVLTGILGVALKGAFSMNTGSFSRADIAVVRGLPGNEPAYRNLINSQDYQRIEESSTKLDLENLFIKDFLENPEVKKVISYRLLDEKTARRDLEDKKIDAAVFLPSNLSRDYIMGKSITLRIVTNTDNTVKKTIIESVMKTFIDKLSLPRITMSVLREEQIRDGIAVEEQNISREKMEGLVHKSGISIDLKQFTEKGRRTVSAMQYYAAAMGVMFILFAAGFAVNNFIEEREEQTMDRLLLSGRSKWEIVAGKGLAVFLVALLQMSVMIAFTTLVLGIHWADDLTALALLTVAAVYAVAGLGILVASLVRSKKGAELFNMLVIQIMAMLGGSFMPIYIMPDSIKAASAFTINGQALTGYLRLMEGAGLDSIMKIIVILLAMGTLFLAAGGAALNPGRGRQAS